MKIIASDYDGTLNYKGIDDQKRDAVKRWREQGNLFALVTGRDRTFCPEMHEESKMEIDCYLACNGAVLMHKNFRVVAESRMEKAIMQPLVQSLFSLNCGYANLCGERLYCIVNDEFRDDPTDGLGLEDVKNISYCNQISTALPSFEEAAAVCAQMQKQFGKYVNPLQNGQCIDIVPAGMDKAKGIYRLLEIVGAKKEDVIAVGDNVNDAAMLKEFYSFAMENGVSAVKEMADEVTRGIAEMIEVLMSKL